MAEEKEEEKKEGEGAEAKPKSKKMLFIIIGVVVLLLGGGGAAMMMGGKKPDPTQVQEQAQEDEEKVEYASFELPTIIVNLSESSSFLKVTMLIEFDAALLERLSKKTGVKTKGEGHGGGGAGGGDAGKAAMPEEFNKRQPMIKDAIIRVISSKRTDELLTLEGKERLKEELIEAINEATALEEGPVVAVYFTEFIIQ